MLANFQVPDVDGSFLPANGEQAAIGTHLERMHCALMVLLYPHTLSIRHLPPAQPAINASTDKPLPARNPTQRNDHPWMPRQGAHSLSALRIPQEQLLTISLPLASGACGKLRAIQAPSHAPDPGRVVGRQGRTITFIACR